MFTPKGEATRLDFLLFLVTVALYRSATATDDYIDLGHSDFSSRLHLCNCFPTRPERSL